MPVDDDFAELMARARTGDQAAVRLFLSRFSREVRIMVRARLPQRLRAQYDSTDFTQAVWLSFFANLAQDAPSFENAVHLRRYLAGVARNKIHEQFRRMTRTQKYDIRRAERLYIDRGSGEDVRDVVSPGPSPSQDAQAEECFDRMTAGCTDREIAVIQLRRLGLTFAEIERRTGINERWARRVISAARGRAQI